LCGILGATDRAGFTEAIAALEFRGSDQRGEIACAGYVLGCQRLAITDPTATQPFVISTPAGEIVVCMNGSLAGPDDLRARLVGCGRRVTSGNDVELAGLLYETFGVEGLRGLRGQFALAIYDEARRRLLLARDWFGEKPLFVREHSDRLPSFASTPRALGQLTGERPRIGPVAAAEFVRFGWIDLAAAGLHAFPKGRIRCYESDGAVSEVRLAEPSKSSEPLARVLERCVAERLHGDRAIAVFLSGGIDSASLALAASRSDRPPACVSMDVAGLPGESDRAGRVAAHLGLEHHAYVMDDGELWNLGRLIELSGMPLGDPSILAVHALAREARRDGFGIALSGEGGDELFLGYRRQRALSWVRTASRLPRIVRRGIALGARGVGAVNRFRRSVAGEPGPDYAELLAVADPKDVGALFPEVDLASTWRDVGAQPAFEWARQVDLDGYLPWDLCIKADIGGLAAGVEIRCPFLDTRLLGYARCHAIAVGEQAGKPALRELLSAVLPAELRGGRKRGFAVPLACWLRDTTWADAILSDPLVVRRVDWPRDLPLAWLAELRAGKDDRAHTLFNLCSLALHEVAR